MKVEIIPCLSDNFSYLIHDKVSDKVSIVDPAEYKACDDVIKKYKKLDFILNTHHHYDHVGGNRELKKKISKFKNIVKVGRTHLQDATPLTLGQEFSGYYSQLSDCILRIETSLKEIFYLAQGGTAVGTGINSKKNFDVKICKEIFSQTRTIH